MSNITTGNNNNNFNPGNYLTREEYERRKKLEQTAAWYNPAQKRNRIDGVMVEPETIYLGEKNERPTWDIPVFNVAKHREDLSLIRQGKINDDRLRYGAYIGEWEDIANEHADFMEYGRAAYNNSYRSANAGIITSGDSPAINVIQILAEVLGRDQRNYVLEQAVTRVATPNLTLSVDSFHGFTASQDVGEGVEPDVKKGKFTRDTYTLKKDAGYVMQTDEASFIADRDVYATSIDHVVRDLRRIKNTKIATMLESAAVTTVAGSDWLAYTADHRTADPIDQVGLQADIIEGNGGIPDTIVSDPQPFREFLMNVGGGTTMQNAPTALTYGGGVSTNVVGLPGFTWYQDPLLTNTRITIYDKSAVLLMQGPVRTAQFRDERRGMDAYITRDWNGVQILDASLIRGLTGVTA